jgi:hypothetical protein
MSRKALNLSFDQIKSAVETTTSAHAASIKLGVTYTSFIRYAKQHGLYAPNQGGKGTAKPKPRKLSLDELLCKSDRTRTHTSGLRVRLIREGILEERCSVCSLTEWMGKKIVLQLDHENGDRQDNTRTNLRLLCPNCHSQTPTFCRGKFRDGKKTLALVA